jgi:hypothetical protein
MRFGDRFLATGHSKCDRLLSTPRRETRGFVMAPGSRANCHRRANDDDGNARQRGAMAPGYCASHLPLSHVRGGWRTATAVPTTTTAARGGAAPWRRATATAAPTTTAAARFPSPGSWRRRSAAGELPPPRQRRRRQRASHLPLSHVLVLVLRCPCPSLAAARRASTDSRALSPALTHVRRGTVRRVVLCVTPDRHTHNEWPYNQNR